MSEVTLEQIVAAIAGNGNSNGNARSNRVYKDVSAKPGETSRSETLDFAFTSMVGGKKVWLTDQVVRRISRGVEQEDGSVRGGGNATYSAQTTGGGFDLPFGLDTEFKVGGILVPLGDIVADDEDPKILRRNNRCEIVLGLDGSVAAVTYDGNGHRVSPESADDIYNVRVLVTKGKKPFFVKMTAQHQSSTGFNGLSGEYDISDYEG